jgi:threonine/homoserine/homoserine lactone efflux protein
VIPLGSFVAVTIPLVLTPGASTALVLRNSLSGGARAGFVTALGINSGSFCYGLLTAFGFALVLQRWPSVMTVIRLGGGTYLAWLGVQSLRRALWPAPAPAVRDRMLPPSVWRNLYEGFLTNALNPAIATFYLVLVPQFIPRGAPVVQSVLLLTIVHVGLAFSWHLVWALAGGTLARTLSAGAPRRTLDALAGAALVSLALVLVTR